MARLAFELGWLPMKVEPLIFQISQLMSQGQLPHWSQEPTASEFVTSVLSTTRGSPPKSSLCLWSLPISLHPVCRHSRISSPTPIHTKPCFWLPQSYRWWSQTLSNLTSSISGMNPAIQPNGDPMVLYMDTIHTFLSLSLIPISHLLICPLFARSIGPSQMLAPSCEIPELCRIYCSSWGTRDRVGKKREGRKWVELRTVDMWFRDECTQG